ncbi:MAG TPA: hypothetical protein VKT80_19920 [Chloroflexota bacterium]|nr:hypothetical protein [Chloroflexota bacterium]
MRITDLKPDNKNARRRTARGHSTIETSLRELGAGRSIVIDRNNRIIAGNGVIENAAKAGITDVEVIESDGRRIIAVMRTDLDLDVDAKTRELAVADNRAAEFAEWDPDVLRDLSADLDLQPFFTDYELTTLTGPDAEPEPGARSGEVDVDAFELAHTCPKCRFQFND